MLNRGRRGYTLLIGWLALAAGVVILLRDLIQVRSLPYAVAGIGMLAFGAWRIQSSWRMR